MVANIVEFSSVLKVEIICTYKIEKRVLTALRYAEVKTGFSQGPFGNFQVRWRQDFIVTRNMSYEDVMRLVKAQVVQKSLEWFGLERELITTISTCANWHVWERLSGVDFEVASYFSTIARDGKLVLKGFWDQLREMKAANENIFDRADRVMLDYLEKS